jgi:hypothetical protein
MMGHGDNLEARMKKLSLGAKIVLSDKNTTAKKVKKSATNSASNIASLSSLDKLAHESSKLKSETRLKHKRELEDLEESAAKAEAAVRNVLERKREVERLLRIQQLARGSTMSSYKKKLISNEGVSSEMLLKTADRSSSHKKSKKVVIKRSKSKTRTGSTLKTSTVVMETPKSLSGNTNVEQQQNVSIPFILPNSLHPRQEDETVLEQTTDSLEQKPQTPTPAPCRVVYLDTVPSSVTTSPERNQTRASTSSVKFEEDSDIRVCSHSSHANFHN